jgi:hypothetical protein
VKSYEKLGPLQKIYQLLLKGFLYFRKLASNENSLIVYINAFKSENYKVNEETTQFRESFVGINWSKQTPLTKYEISPIKGIFDKIHIIT